MLRSVLTFLFVTAAAANAWASHLQLLWSAPSNCPDATQIRAQIDALLGKSAEDVLTRPLYVAATVTQQGEDQWELEVVWHRAGAESSRRLQSDSCADLARAAALTTALLIDPDAEATGARTASPVNSTSSESPVVGTLDPKPPTRATWRSVVSRPFGAVRLKERASRRERDQPPYRARVFAAGTLEVGTLQHAAFGAALGAQLARGRLFARAELSALLPETWAEVGYSGTLWLVEASLGPCYTIGSARFQLSPCVGAVLQSYRAQTNGDSGQSGTAHWAGLLRTNLGFDLRYLLLADVSLLGSAWLMVAADRPEFRLRPDTAVFTPDLTAFRLTLGASYDLY